MCRRCPPKFEVQVDGKTIGVVDWWKAMLDKHVSLRHELTELGRSQFIPGPLMEFLVRGNLYVTNRHPSEESDTVKHRRNEKGEIVRTDYFNERGDVVAIEEVCDIDFQALKDLLPKDCKP